MSINGLQTRTDIAKLKQEFDLTKLQLADIMVKQKMDNDKLEAMVQSLKMKTEFLDRYTSVVDIIETEDDAQRLLDAIAALRREKMAKQET